MQGKFSPKDRLCCPAPHPGRPSQQLWQCRGLPQILPEKQQVRCHQQETSWGGWKGEASHGDLARFLPEGPLTAGNGVYVSGAQTLGSG